MTEGLSAELLNSDVLAKSRENSARTLEDLDRLLSTEIPGYTSEDTSLVVFGSLARGEWTSKSDLDWTFLIDGGANSDSLANCTRDTAGSGEGKISKTWPYWNVRKHGV